MKTIWILCGIALGVTVVTRGDAAQLREVGREEYLAYVRGAAEDGWNAVDAERVKFRSTIDVHNVFGYLNDMQTFVTVLIPHDKAVDPKSLVKRIQSLPVEEMRRTLGITITSGETSYMIGLKMDYQADLTRDWRRPRYSYETGQVKCGDFATDAMSFFATVDSKKVKYTMVVGSKITCTGRVLREQGPEECDLAFDGSRPQPGVLELSYWTGETEP